MTRLWIVLGFLAACGADDGDDGPSCATGSPCTTPGDMCAGFESDFECTAGGHWTCVPSGRVGDPCVAPDAPVDAP